VPRLLEVLDANGDGTHTREPFEYRMLHKDGSWVWLESTASDLLNDPAVRGVVVNSRDITERKQAEEALAHQARHDPLTGLPNRALMVDRIAVALANLDRSDRVMAVLFLDLDRFKLINDGLGHAAGDELLVAVAERLTAVLRPGDTIARQGGDEFAVLCVDLHDPAEAVLVADRLAEAMLEPFVLEGTPTFVTTSIGIAIADATSTTDPDELLSRADAAMYQAKEHGRARYELFDADMQAEAAARLERRNAVRHAAEHRQFRLVYQPELDLKGGDLWMEALLRWDHPERGVVGPDEFIAVAEESGIIVPVGRWVLEEACRQAQEWREDHPGRHPTAIGVNLSPRQLADADLVRTVANVLDDSGLPPHMLFLEITENAVVDDPEKALDVLRDLKT
jgi:diguanylate cyclase (GGDEF)-like protein